MLTTEQHDLIETHIQIAQIVGGRAKTQLFYKTDPEQALSDAYMGLVIAAQKYKPALGASFRTYAFLKVAKHMLDVKRQGLGRTDFWRRNFWKKPIQIFSFDAPMGKENDYKNTKILTYRDTPELDKSDWSVAFLNKITRRLKKKEKSLIEYRIFQGEKFNKIAAHFDLSESRVLEMWHDLRAKLKRIAHEEGILADGTWN